MKEVEIIELTPENLGEFLKTLDEEQAINAMQHLANAHGLAVATFAVPDGIDRVEFMKTVTEKVEEAVGERPDLDATSSLAKKPSEFFEKILRQKAEIEKANIQHCEHNSRSALAYQIVGLGISQDDNVETQPEAFRRLFDTACNVLRDTLTGVPTE